MIYFAVFATLFIVDFAWAKYIGSVKDGAAMKAAKMGHRFNVNNLRAGYEY